MHQVDHARKWLQIVEMAGINLHEYADREKELHDHEHYLNSTWDDELWSWIPTKKRVSYKYGQDPKQLKIWLEDYDALGWFRCGQYDLDIFQLSTPAERVLRWKNINAPTECLEIITKSAAHKPTQNIVAEPGKSRIYLPMMWGLALVVTLTLNYFVHILMVRT